MAGRAAVTATDAATGKRGGTCSITQASKVAASGATPGESGNTPGSAAGCLSMTSSRVSMVVPCFAYTAPSIAAENTSWPRSCRHAKASVQAGLSGAKLDPVIATRRPPSRSRARAEVTWRSAASAMRRSTFAIAEKGGFIRTTLGAILASR
jgi:hypothetical protein